MISFITAERASTSSSYSYFILWGIAYSVALFLADFLQSLVVHHLFNRLNIYWIKIEESLMSAILTKTLKLSAHAKQEFTSGEIVNLMRFVHIDHILTCIVWIVEE